MLYTLEDKYLLFDLECNPPVRERYYIVSVFCVCVQGIVLM
jgi:hypothetical protein